MKKICLLAILLIAFSQQKLSAQALGNTYKTAVGVKFYPLGVSLKTFIRSDAALDFIGYFYDRGTRITGLYEYHGKITDAGNLKFYIGPGAHVGLYNKNFFAGGTSVGIDGVVGLDFKFPSLPIDLSIDWQPSYEFGNYDGFISNSGGIGIRFTF